MPDIPAAQAAFERPLFTLAQIQHFSRVEAGRARRYRYPLTCLVVAIDRLGHLRDVHGYEAKEKVFAGVVRLLLAATRPSDFIGRAADDRLMAIVPHTPPEGARTLAARLVEAVRAHPFEVDGRRAVITLSAGLAVDPHGESLFSDALLEAAESALADATQAGGGRWVERTLG